MQNEVYTTMQRGVEPQLARHQAYAGLETYMSTNDLYILYRIQSISRTHTYQPP